VTKNKKFKAGTAEDMQKVHDSYREAQLLQRQEKSASLDEMKQLSGNWQDEELPALQRKVVAIQLENLRSGIVDVVFLTLIELLKKIPLKSFSFLDVACASGYYFEVIRALDSRPIQYHGCDYSESMIRAAHSFYPGTNFEVQDLRNLKYNDRSFDVVMAAGVMEHIPDWIQALSEVCRVADQYVIHHRCPITPGQTHEYTIGTQYNIETPRIFFGKQILLAEYRSRGFHLIKEIDVYNRLTLRQKARKAVKSFLGRGELEPVGRTTKSLLLRREA
jgi:ubiquinone/menaquinone biosynthesis C-methylase UbiE